jgi:hypothetical protein
LKTTGGAAANRPDKSRRPKLLQGVSGRERLRRGRALVAH